MLTASTITDEQIRELMQTVSGRDRADCAKALQNLCIGYAPKHERAMAEREQRAARARCAEILNARANGPLTGKIIMQDDVWHSTEILLKTAQSYGKGVAGDGNVVAAAYRLAAAKLRDQGAYDHAKDLDRAANQAEKR